MGQRYRFSIRGLMALIVLLAFAFAALRYPSRLWANAWFTLALGAVTLAVPAAIGGIGSERAFWCGFAVCGWVYFLVSLAPWIHAETGYQLLSTTILDVGSPYIIDNRYLVQSYVRGFNPPSAPESPTPWQVWNLPDFPQEANYRQGYATLHCPWLYLRIGHAAFCLLAAFLGGEAARYLYARRSRPGAADR
ncbi:MAG: hypothetical protein ACLQGP_23040 [Isosphaeraceae bacterium]